MGHRFESCFRSHFLKLKLFLILKSSQFLKARFLNQIRFNLNLNRLLSGILILISHFQEWIVLEQFNQISKKLVKSTLVLFARRSYGYFQFVLSNSSTTLSIWFFLLGLSLFLLFCLSNVVASSTILLAFGSLMMGIFFSCSLHISRHLCMIPFNHSRLFKNLIFNFCW